MISEVHIPSEFDKSKYFKPGFWLALLFIVVLGFSCTNKGQKTESKQAQEFAAIPIDPDVTNNAKTLYSNLFELSKEKVLFGHQDDLAYGVGWEYQEGRSDTKETSGSLPAVFGWDIGGIGLGLDKNLDSIPFSKMKVFIRSAHKYGGINTISWHTFNPISHKDSWVDISIPDSTVENILPGSTFHASYIEMLDDVADFLLDLKDENGNLIPIFFRPFHENNGNWFWWGKLHCTPDQYKELYRFTVSYLINERDVHNLLFAYSPDRNFESKVEYLERYPGDQFVDVIGFDDYHSFKIGDTSGVIKRLQIVSDLAAEKNKIAAFTETGMESIEDPKTFTEIVLPLINHDEKTRQIAWVLVWRNANEKHHYAPYPGHPSEEDFVKFRNNELILFGDDLPDLYKVSKH